MFRNDLGKFKVLLLICALLTISLKAQENYKLLPVKVGGQWGFIDTKGKMVISPQFNSANVFSGGLAPVWKNTNKCGYINLNGQIAIDAKFDYCGLFSEGLAVVKVKDKYGYIDKYGKFLVAPKWEMAWGFSDGLARVLSGKLINPKYGFLNKKGQVVIKPQFPYANDFNESLALVAINTKRGLRIGFVGRNGKLLISPIYGSATNFSEGFAAVTTDGKPYLLEGSLMFDAEDRKFRVFYIKKSGVRAFDKNFDRGAEFSEGLASVETDGKKAFINYKGEAVKITEFTPASEISKFSEGLAAVNFMDGAKFIDVKGNIVIQTNFNWADSFIDGVARVKNVQTNGIESYGYIDNKGNTIWKPTN